MDFSVAILRRGRLSDPLSTGAKQLTVSETNFDPTRDNFHKHPGQEVAVLFVAGQVEQRIDREKRILNPGDSAGVPADVVHASFNSGDQPVKIIAILGPCVGPNGYEVIYVANDAQWKTLRKVKNCNRRNCNSTIRTQAFFSFDTESDPQRGGISAGNALRVDFPPVVRLAQTLWTCPPTQKPP
ncbi:cupin domain-containing protein [Bradyrhizobium sp. ARR65]|uniref:cupin domain-containing protein n=1 Tax=Bradyrhizobium sp. ARR65 TaxID=1040989 RepID=UPI0004678F13|nr:cupin domain-containing protein [Bradyrhizobium sp. ARR65]